SSRRRHTRSKRDWSSDVCSSDLAYLGSSFAFISPVFVVLNMYGGDGYSYVLGGFLAVGIVLCLVALIVKIVGTAWIDILFPPAAMGAIVAVIGLELVPVAAEMAGWIPSEEAGESWTIDLNVALVSLATLLITIISWVTLRGFLKIIPILIGIVAGYFIAFMTGLVDWTAVYAAHWISTPQFYSMKIDWSAILIILPAALVIIPEHIGHLFV